MVGIPAQRRRRPAGPVNQLRWLVELAVPYLGDDPLQVGAGTGELAAAWLPAVGRLTVADADPERVVALKERLGGHPKVTVRQLALPTEERAAYSAVICYQVLEHQRDDVAALASLRGLLRPGGAALVVVPAFDFAGGLADAVAGHLRRYHRAGLRRVLERAGYTVTRLHYANALGLLGYYLFRGDAAWYDRVVVPVTRQIERLRRPPFGQTVFAVARNYPSGR